MTPFQAVRAGRREALTFLGLGEGFSPSTCALMLRAYRGRLSIQAQATHDPHDRRELLAQVAAVEEQINSLEKTA